MTDLILDTTVIAKGIFPPRRTKEDEIYEQRMELHRKARTVLEEIEGEDEPSTAVPTAALIETAAVGARLTGKKDRGLEATEWIRAHLTTIYDYQVLDQAIDVAADTRASGFDSLFITCARANDCRLVTDDKGMHEAAENAGIESRLLRNM